MTNKKKTHPTTESKSDQSKGPASAPDLFGPGLRVGRLRFYSTNPMDGPNLSVASVCHSKHCRRGASHEITYYPKIRSFLVEHHGNSRASAAFIPETNVMNWSTVEQIKAEEG